LFLENQPIPADDPEASVDNPGALPPDGGGQ